MQSRTFTLLSSVFFLFLTFTACKEDEGPDLHLSIPAPESITVTDQKAKVATINWEYADTRAQTFTIEISANNSFAPILQTKTVEAGIKTVSFDNLGSLTPYFVRIQALADDPMYHSHYATSTFTSSEIESIFLAVNRADITPTTVILKWDAPKKGSVNKIIVTPTGGTALAPVQLSAADIAAKKITISNLISATSYTAEIFENEETKGEVSFSTKDVNSRITINGTGTNYELLQDAVNAARSGDVIKFGPAVYDFSAATNSVITINGKALTFEAEVAGARMPEITLKTFVLKGNIPSLKVSGLKIKSISKSTDTDYEKHIFGATYLTGETNIVLENSDFSGAEAGLLFTQTVGAANAPEPIAGSGVLNLTVDNCLLHDFGNAGGDFIDFRSGTLGKITFKNSTLWKAGRAIFRGDATATATAHNILLIENSTFNSFANGGAFIRMATPGVSVQVTKCIIANKTSANNNVVSGAGTTLKFNQNNVFGTNAASINSVITSGFNVGTTALDPGFADAANGSFTVSNATLKAAGVGDPRWIK